MIIIKILGNKADRNRNVAEKIYKHWAMLQHEDCFQVGCDERTSVLWASCQNADIYTSEGVMHNESFEIKL